MGLRTLGLPSVKTKKQRTEEEAINQSPRAHLDAAAGRLDGAVELLLEVGVHVQRRVCRWCKGAGGDG